jgi:hypothetical protein
MKRVFTTVRKKRTVENESWFYHIFRKNSVLVHAKTTTSYDMVENALTQIKSNKNLSTRQEERTTHKCSIHSGTLRGRGTERSLAIRFSVIM